MSNIFGYGERTYKLEKAGSYIKLVDSEGETSMVVDSDTTYSVGDNGLTQNNFTNTLKSKLDGIEENAQENVNADWTGSGDAEILNKPTIPSGNQIIDWTEDQGFTNIHPNNYSDTQLSTEQVQDIIGDMVTGNTETNMSCSYDDTNGKLDFVSAIIPQLTTEQVQDIVGGMIDNTDELNYTDATGKINFRTYKFYDIKFSNFQGSSFYKYFFIPFTSTGEYGSSSSALDTPSSASERCQFVAPYDGQIVKLLFRSEITQSDGSQPEIEFKLCEATAHQELVATDDTQIGSTLTRTSTLSDDNTASFFPGNWILTSGNSYGIYLACSDAPIDTQITIVFEYELG